MKAAIPVVGGEVPFEAARMREPAAPSAAARPRASSPRASLRPAARARAQGRPAG
ncbi:hypothetical protein [Paracoccus mutanolyticus]|uniref:hypothetical protein n=1 Tax=Paracoccus mutanolyticus TaxID=1499308 RepID=UPI0037CB12D6